MVEFLKVEVFIWLLLGNSWHSGICQTSPSAAHEELGWPVWHSSSSSASSSPLMSDDSSSKEPPLSREELLQNLLRMQQKEIHVEDFLWTGSGDGALPDYDYEKRPDDLDNRLEVKLMPTTLTVTQMSTVFVVHPTVSLEEGLHEIQETDGHYPPVHTLKPTPVLPPGAITSTLGPSYVPLHPHPGAKTGGMPDDQFLVRTVVLSNMTIIHNRVEHFKHQMEQKLTRAYRKAYDRKRFKRSVQQEEFSILVPHGRRIRAAVEEKVDEEKEVKTEPESAKLLRPDDTSPAALLHTPDQSEDTARTKRHRTPPTVQIHNIWSSLPKPEIEMLYTVYKDEEPLPAIEAVQALQDVDDTEVEQVLGFPIVTKAEPYTAKSQRLVATAGSQTSILVAALIVAALVILLVLLALLFLLHRAKRAGLDLKHSRLMGSPDHTTGESREASPTGVQTSITTPNGSMDRKAFTLDRPRSKPSLAHVSSEEAEEYEADQKDDKLSRAQTRSSLHLEVPLSRSSSTGAAATAGGESPSLADLSSNNGDDSPQRSKRVGGGKRSAKHRQRLSAATPTGGYSSGAEQLSQSAFPVPTPDRLGPLTDLLEEEIVLPGESRETSASGAKRRNKGDWAYLPRPRSPGSTSSSDSYKEEGTQMSPWREEAARTREMARQYREVLNDTFNQEAAEDEEKGRQASPSETASALKKRAASAKSHIFRKGKIESKLSKITKCNKTRPWSAHEARLQADPIFHMRQRHWEGLIAGKKRLHRGQLLPGSTSEEEDKKRGPPPTCWSECSSPRKQVRISETRVESAASAITGDERAVGTISGASDVATPLIQAIKEELQKFHRPRSPNLAGISIISDPDLLQKDSHA